MLRPCEIKGSSTCQVTLYHNRCQVFWTAVYVAFHSLFLITDINSLITSRFFRANIIHGTNKQRDKLGKGIKLVEDGWGEEDKNITTLEYKYTRLFSWEFQRWISIRSQQIHWEILVRSFLIAMYHRPKAGCFISKMLITFVFRAYQ